MHAPLAFPIPVDPHCSIDNYLCSRHALHRKTLAINSIVNKTINKTLHIRKINVTFSKSVRLLKALSETVYTISLKQLQEYILYEQIKYFVRSYY